MASIAKKQGWFDGAAIAASAVCLVHCLVLPVLIILLPTLTAFLTLPEEFHKAALAIAVPVSALALWTGYRRHRAIKAALVVLPGLLLMVVGALAAPSDTAETVLTVVGAVLLAIGHARNWRVGKHVSGGFHASAGA